MTVALNQTFDLTNQSEIILFNCYTSDPKWSNEINSFLTNNTPQFYDVNRGRLVRGAASRRQFHYPDTRFLLVETTVPDKATSAYYGPLSRHKDATYFSVEPGFRTIQYQGEAVWTELPDFLVKKLEECLDLTEIATEPFSTTGYIDDLSGINRFSNGERIRTDTDASLSLLSAAYSKKFLEKHAATSKTRKKVLRLKRMYRGGDALPDMSIESQTYKQILSGDRFFLFTRWVAVLNQKTMKTKQIKVLCLGTFTDRNRITTSRKALNFLNVLAQAIKQDTLDRLLDPDAYTKKQREKFGKMFHRWDGLLSLIPDQHHEGLLQHQWDRVQDTLKNEDHLKSKDFKLLNAAHLGTTPTGKAATRARDALRRSESKVASAQRIKHKHEREAEQHRRSIKDSKNRIAMLTTQLDIAQEQINSREKVLAELQTALPTLKEQAKKTKAAHAKVIEEFLKNPSGPDWYESLREAGIIINDIVYTHMLTHATASIIDIPDAATDNSYELTAIHVTTLAPTVIEVDKRSKNKPTRQIAGGPYEIILRKDHGSNGAPYCRLRLAGMNAIFGWKTYSASQVQIKPHPHVKEARIYRDPQSFERWAQGWHACCLGELEPALVKAFSKKQPRAAIYSVLAWITSCDTDDDWGKSWSWFPLKDDVQWDEPTSNPDAAFEPKNLKVRLENADMGRFWEAEVNDKEYLARWGKLGSPGRKTSKVHLSNSAALAYAEETIARKLNLGYIKIEPTTTATP